jgi:type I restriction enzyme S subunit
MAGLTGRKPQFKRGDIVYGYLRPYLNKVWVAEFDGLCSVDQYVYSVDPTVADTEFLAWFMRSPVYLARAPIKTTPGQLPRIRTEEVASVRINLPPCEKQKEVAAYLHSRMEAVREARAGLEDEWSAIGALPAAILRRAFSGEI